MEVVLQLTQLDAFVFIIFHNLVVACVYALQVIPHATLKWKYGRAITQTRTRRPFTAGVQVRYQAGPYRICGVRISTGAAFSLRS